MLLICSSCLSAHMGSCNAFFGVASGVCMSCVLAKLLGQAGAACIWFGGGRQYVVQCDSSASFCAGSRQLAERLQGPVLGMSCSLCPLKSQMRRKRCVCQQSLLLHSTQELQNAAALCLHLLLAAPKLATK